MATVNTIAVHFQPLFHCCVLG